MITFEAKINDKTVRLYAAYPMKNAAGAIFKTLTQLYNQNKADIFNENFILGFGWSLFYLSERKDDKGNTFYVVQSNDYRKNPMNGDKTDDITLSLLAHNMQVDTVRVANVQPEVATFRDTILVLKDAMNAPDVYMNRNEAAKNGDSGWYFGLLDDPNEENHTADDYIKLPSFELFKFRSEAIRVMEMPVGTVAVFHENVLIALVDGNDQPLKFTTEEERKAIAERSKAEFEAEVAAAKARAGLKEVKKEDV